MSLPVFFARFPPVFAAQKDLKELALLRADPRFYFDHGEGFQELYPATFTHSTLDEFKDLLWDFHQDYQKDYRLLHLADDDPPPAGDPPRDLQNLYLKITRARELITAPIDYNYLPDGSVGSEGPNVDLPPGATLHALPPGGPPYDFDVWSWQAGPVEVFPLPPSLWPDIGGTVYYKRPDIGPNVFSQWDWTAPGQNAVVYDTPGNGYKDFIARAHPDPVVVNAKIPVRAIIFPNFRSFTDALVIPETENDPPVIFYEITPPLADVGKAGDWWVDTSAGEPFTSYGPKSATWPSGSTEPIPNEVFEAAKKYKSKIAQILSGLVYTRLDTRPLWLFDSSQVVGVWQGVHPIAGYPADLPPQLEIREGDYRPASTLGDPGPDGKLSPFPSFLIAIYLPPDSHFPVGGVPNSQNGNRGPINNPVLISPSDDGSASGSSGRHALGESENEQVDSAEVEWTDALGDTQTALLVRNVASYQYLVELSARPFS